MKNATSMEWNVVVDEFTLDENDGNLVSIEKRFINKNLLFINFSDFSEIRFGLSHLSEDFEFNLFEFGLSAVMGFELNISSQKQVALEFDLRGESSAVNGFYAWIRTLDLSAATGTTLNISLYKANRTIARTRSNLENIPLQPNMSTLIDTKNFTYLGDGITYFEFNLENTSDLSFYNYFIVIKSNASSGTYSLVTIAGKPDSGDNDDIDHQLRMTSDGGNSWAFAKIS